MDGKCEVSCLHSRFVSCNAAPCRFLVIFFISLFATSGPMLFRRAASTWWHSGSKYSYECCKVTFFVFPSFGRARQTCRQRFFWVDHGPDQRRIDAFGQTDRCPTRIWHDSLPQGESLVRLNALAAAVGGHKNGRLVCLPTLYTRAFPLVSLTSPAITA